MPYSTVAMQSSPRPNIILVHPQVSKVLFHTSNLYKSDSKTYAKNKPKRQFFKQTKTSLSAPKYSMT